MNYIVSKDIDINELCKGWEEDDTHYKLELFLGSEFVKINKESRLIVFKGFKSLIRDWKKEKIIVGTFK